MVRQFTKHAKYGTIKKGRFEAQKAPSVRSHVSGHDCKRALRKANWLKIVNAEAENWLSKKMCWNGLVEKERAWLPDGNGAKYSLIFSRNITLSLVPLVTSVRAPRLMSFWGYFQRALSQGGGVKMWFRDQRNAARNRVPWVYIHRKCKEQRVVNIWLTAVV